MYLAIFNLNHFLQHSRPGLGVLVVAVIVFLESGIPIGFFLPGDTMLFSAGFFASQHYLPLDWLIFSVIVAKLLGSNVGYVIGKTAGRKLFSKPGSVFFRSDFLDSAEAFYEKHGGKTVTIGQFIPVIRTFTPVVAGIAKMKQKTFLIYNFIGAVAWGGLIIVLGYEIGNRIPNIDKYLLPAVILAMLFAFAPAGWHLFGKKDSRDRIKQAIRNRKK
ncbi:MAG TPA: DedA family protein [Candidatus Saccharimonadales bacterium]|nr:DedA family protein [Candidatus Saccharimonadales bacterium]